MVGVKRIQNIKHIVYTKNKMPAATRIGDADLVHCSGMVRAKGSRNVFVNGISWSLQTHNNTAHLLPGDPCPTHAAPISRGDQTVFVNNIPCGRIGDPTCTAVGKGSRNVFAGDAAAALNAPTNVTLTTAQVNA